MEDLGFFKVIILMGIACIILLILYLRKNNGGSDMWAG